MDAFASGREKTYKTSELSLRLLPGPSFSWESQSHPPCLSFPFPTDTNNTFLPANIVLSLQ